MSENAFVLPADQYKRDINFLNHYVEQSAHYLAKMRNIPYEQAEAFIRNSVKPGGSHAFKDVKFTHTYKKPNGDREKRVSGLAAYIAEAVNHQDIIAPTLTRYVNVRKLEAPLVGSITKNVTKRNISKKAMFEAQARKDKALEIWKNGEQTGFKLSNNAVSGAAVSVGTALYNRTGHSTLTSTCRVTSGFGNANNEKLLAGNRHYHNYKIAMFNIASICSNTDYAQLEAMLTKYQLHIPTAEETFEVIARSGSQYFRGWKSFGPIKAYVDALNPLERAAFVYTGDLYHVMQYNPDFMRTFITRLGERIYTPLDLDTAKQVIKAADDDIISLVNQIWNEEMKGNLLKDLVETELYRQIAATIVNVNTVVAEYYDFIRAILVTKNVPASLGYFPASIRHVALTSDTDSTIFTVQDWVKWYRGDYVMDDVGIMAMAVMVYLTSQSIVHVLAIMSANIGVDKEKLHQISMKNEYRFDVFVPTNETKHYYGIIGCREGNVYAKYKQEIKGVHLRSSKVVAEVMAAAAKKMLYICETVAKGEKISINDELANIFLLETSIVDDVKSGKSSYFRFEQIKTADTYRKTPDSSPYAQYTLWRDVFAPKYGDCEAPPYSAMKLNSIVTTDNAFAQWLKELPDQAFADRFRKWLKQNNKTCIRTFLLPRNIISAKGIPDVLFPLIDIRRLIVDNMSVFYKIGETLAFHQLDSNINVLLTDYKN